MSRTKSNKNLFVILGSKGDGKTTIGTYLVHKFDQATVIFDVARQFDKRDYRIFVNSVSQLQYYLNNKEWRKSFYSGSLQLVYRPDTQNLQGDIESACNVLKSVHNITIFFEEMELYADSYLNKKSPIFDICYLMRNRGHTIICVAKQAGKLSNLIKEMGDYFFIGKLRSKSALRFFDEIGGKELTKEIQGTSAGEFLILDRGGVTTPYKLSNKIAKII